VFILPKGKPMRANAIYAGGGVKGAALAGCLRAAEQQGVKFVGHGGTSAGSMVALMAVVGYTGEQLEKILVEELDFRELLDDRGVRLKGVQTKVEGISSALSSGGLVRQFCAVNFTAPTVLKGLGAPLGLYHGRELKDFLLCKIKEKVPALADHADITFEHLRKAGCLPVKIVASDITFRRPAIFSLDHTEYGASVIDAVRASTCYPFAFQPVFLNGSRLVDGGLSSNLPVFLFAQEYQRDRTPALAFDLTAPRGPGGESYSIGQYGNDLLSTALEASDKLMRRVLRGVYYIPVKTPTGIRTLDFDLSRDDRKRLFDAGYKATMDSLENLEPLKRVKMAGDQLQKQLQAEFGPPQFFTPVLHALAKDIEANTKAKGVRAHIMLPTGREPPTRIVTYNYGMERSTDIDLELPETAGCSGKAWSERAPILADLAEADKDPAPWGMTKQQHDKVPRSQVSMLSVPIHSRLAAGENQPPAPVGTLSVDSTTALNETGWLETISDGPRAHPTAVRIMMSWAYIVRRLLPE
jgi:NTE family protein